ncbi:hypothetical protein VIBNISO65_1590041 [Vibrio nigripulchritudo SO65]|nr:hypothetical protein VIBNIAM115_790040 [Vibrio nigripulchritudo AM115]CCN38974.1 hypothetical protein VIBNIFTn2_100039 [Vibrio nigripulchritudo FTn2]CCN76441.1 hypothetical protein VIBNISO65_1590041 [Vibrio nigripulchritudo SO65]
MIFVRWVYALAALLTGSKSVPHKQKSAVQCGALLQQ